MRSLQTVLAAILLTGCTLCEASAPTLESRPEGGDFMAGLVTISYEVQKCYLETPFHEIIEFRPRDTSGQKYDFMPTEFIECQVLIKDLNQNDNGIWTIYSESSTGIKNSRSYDVTVFVPTTTPAPETTVSTTTESTVSVEYLTTEYINTTLGTNHTIIIRDYAFVTSERCYLETPKGKKIDLNDLNELDIIEVILHPDAACAVRMIVKSDDVVGDWVLISEGSRFSSPIERRLPFTIRVEECPSCTSPSLPATTSRPEGGDFIAGIVTITDKVEKCYLETPSLEIVEFKPHDTSEQRYDFSPTEFINCRVLVKDLHQNDNGIWTIYSESSTGMKRSQSYDVTVFEPTTTPAPETTVSTTTESTVSVEYLPTEYINTTLGTNHTIVIRDFSFVTSERCILETPQGQRIDLHHSDTPDTIEVISHPEAACGIKMFVTSEDVVGDWLLISEGTRFSTPTERRLPFTIRVEEQVDASVDEVTLAEGNNFYIRLENAIPNFDSCRLFGPNGYRDFERDERFTEKCGFIVKNVKTSDSGAWEIHYGNNILYTARVLLTVNGNSDRELPSLTWHRDDNINITLGPEYAVYCRLETPTGGVVFDSFGRCRAVVDRVTTEHDGDWKMNIGVPGGVFTENYKVAIRVIERAQETPVTTSVIPAKPVMIITCSTTSSFPLKSCKFRSPHGNILLATEGVGQGRFSFHGSGSRLNNSVYSHECGFQITNPIVQDQGFWRCALDTGDTVHYGFLMVLSPWLMRDPEIVAGIVREPTLSSQSVRSAAGSGAALRCSTSAALRYCYFRARNGTVFNVDPTSPSYEGGGYHSGECGMRFPSLEVSDSGFWSCHVGIDKRDSVEELRASINVTVYDPMVAELYVLTGGIVLSAMVHGRPQLEYCRFVRSDGFGFTSTMYVSGYVDRSDLSIGHCGLRVFYPNMVERGPWTVAARPVGGDEIVRVVGIFQPEQTPRPDGPRYYSFSSIGVILLATGVILIIVSAVIAPKKNRQWARERATALRNSFTRKPPPVNNTNNTACAA